MASIIPFKAVLYNKDKIADITSILAPPYDAIPKDSLATYYNSSKYNIAHLILPRDYKTSAKLFHQWLKEKILISDADEAIYLYEQEYILSQKKLRRLGFVALLKIERYLANKVFPHENTFDGPKKDRLMLLKEVKANLCPVFFVYPHNECRRLNTLLKDYSRRHKPYLKANMIDETDRLWKITEPLLINAIISEMQDSRLVIADGHHRYEVAVEFSNVYPYVMGYFCDSAHPGLTILPTHRLAKNLDISCVKRLFNIIRADSKEKMFSLMKAQKRNIFGMYTSAKFYILSLKNSRTQELKNSRTLDVSILHSTILKDINDIFYTSSAGEAITLVNAGGFKVAFFLKPTPIDAVVNCALSGIRMPHKSTYFYPKLMSGLVMNKFDMI